MIAIETTTQIQENIVVGTIAWASGQQKENRQQRIKKSFSDESLNQVVENFSQQKYPSANSNFLPESLNKNNVHGPSIIVTDTETNKQPLLAPFLFEYDFLSGTRKSRSNSEVSNCNKAECLKNAQDYDQDESVINIYLENHEHLEQDWNSRTVLDTCLNSDEEELYIPKQALELSQSLPRFPFLVDQFPSSQTKNENSFENNQITQQEQLQKTSSIEDLSLNFSYFLLNHAPKDTNANDSYGNDLSSMICGTNIEWGFSSMISSSIAFNDVHQPSFRDGREFQLGRTSVW
ncbi:11495_t:CDS:1 [Ambispora gerdemannii]|uniref:11495_t:CDS:1 n=1 Tax=Ambispora gerdemannii TaxID=144530 RepID=A0A9N8ZQ48_9GLOM|nr:11495_t:CDS:1 [Ambispora gerdemannii]